MNAKMSEGFQLIHDVFRLKWIPEIIDGKEGYYLTSFGKDLNHVFNHFIDMSEKYINKTSIKEF